MQGMGRRNREAVRRGVAALLWIALSSGCGTLYYEAPAGSSDVMMMDRFERAQVRVERKTWYWLWGMYAITDDSSESLIVDNQLREVRFGTVQTLGDTLLNFITGLVTIVRRTLIVEGNP